MKNFLKALEKKLAIKSNTIVENSREHFLKAPSRTYYFGDYRQLASLVHFEIK